MDYSCYRLDALPSSTGDESLLDDEERQVFMKRGKIYLLSRCLIKREISRRTGTPVHEIHFRYAGKGKPVFPGIHFNLSHSGNLLCLAFHHAPIGVDIQQIRPVRISFGKIARRIMCPEQYAAFLEHGCPASEFFACWCAAEAQAKRTAGSLWHSRQFPFLYTEKGIRPMYGEAPAIELFEPAPGYLGALAY